MLEKRMKTTLELLVRAVVIVLCGFALWKSIQLARADYSFAPGTTAGLHRAMAILPADADYATRGVLRRLDDGEDSPDVDAALTRTARLNPLSSELQMTLGLRAEQHGDLAQAEHFLLQATQLDHQYKPAWTLANFCYRTGRMDNFWPMVKRCLALEPTGFDPTAVFDLCWRITDDAKKIQAFIPRRGETALAYLQYLTGNKRWEPALAWWPVALEAMDRSDKHDVDAIVGFTDAMLAAERMPEAARIWNQLVDRSLVKSGRLDPATAISIADPEFSFPRNAGAFSWRITEGSGIFPASDFSALRLELDGNQPQSVRLLITNAPVLADRKYRLVWKSDGTRLSLPADPGFGFRILTSSGAVLAECPPLLGNGGKGVCSFSTPANLAGVQVDLQYARAPGTTRSSGVLELSSVRLEFGS